LELEIFNIWAKKQLQYEPFWLKLKVKVKVKVKVEFTPEQATKTQRGNRGIVLLFL
jgi:hypothetical protein